MPGTIGGLRDTVSKQSGAILDLDEALGVEARP